MIVHSCKYSKLSRNHLMLFHDRYCGHSEAQQKEMARLAVGLLPAAIIQGFTSVAASDDRGGRLTLYSAHDNTIMALLAHLGFTNFPIPRFAAHVIFELHEVAGEFFVKALYNPDPDFYGFSCDEHVFEGFLKPCDYFSIPTRGLVDW